MEIMEKKMETTIFGDIRFRVGVAFSMTPSIGCYKVGGQARVLGWPMNPKASKDLSLLGGVQLRG